MNAHHSPNINALREQVMGGQFCRMAGQDKNKGAIGQWVEQYLRASPEGKLCEWADGHSPKPDCAGLEVKIVTRVRMKRGAEAWRIPEDLALGMIGAASFEHPFEQSGVQSKLNLLLVIMEVIDGRHTIVNLINMDLRKDTQIHCDYENARWHFMERYTDPKAPMGACWIVDSMGKDSPGYGVAVKTKTKGAGRSKRKAKWRSRAFYLRRSFVQERIAAAIKDQA
jgi:hypothetical protein